MKDKAAESRELGLEFERKDALRQQQLAEQTVSIENALKKVSKRNEKA